MKWFLTIIMTFTFLSSLIAQNDEIDLEQFAERLFQVQDENIAYEDIYESLLLYYTNKLNLNKIEPQDWLLCIFSARLSSPVFLIIDIDTVICYP